MKFHQTYVMWQNCSHYVHSAMLSQDQRPKKVTTNKFKVICPFVSSHNEGQRKFRALSVVCAQSKHAGRPGPASLRQGLHDSAWS